MIRGLFKINLVNRYQLILVIIVFFSFLILFLNLDKRHLSQDIIHQSTYLKPIMQYHWKDVHEKRYAEIGRRIVETNDWLTLKWEGRSYYNKGPVFFWLSAIVYKISGGVQYAGRILSAIFSLGIIFFTYLLAKDIFDKKTAIWAMVILITSVHFVIASREGTLDIAIVFWGLSSIYFYFKYQCNKNYLYFFTAMILLAIMGLTKSIFSVIPIILAYFVLDIRNLFSANISRNVASWLSGVLILVLTLVSWVGMQAYLYPLYQREGVSFSKILLDAQLNKTFFNTATTHEIIKYTGGKKYAAECIDDAEKQKFCPEYDNPFYEKNELKKISNFFLYYPYNILKGFFPWSILLVLALSYNVWLLFKFREPKLNNIMFIFVIIVLMFILTFEKRAKWLVVVYPFLSIFCAKLIDELLSEKSIIFLKFGFVASMILFSIILFPFKFINWQFDAAFYAVLLITLYIYIFATGKVRIIAINLIISYLIIIGLFSVLSSVFLLKWL